MLRIVFMRRLAALTLALVGVASARSANACGDTAGTPPPCISAYFFVPFDGALPANVPAIPFTPSTGSIPTTPTLLAADGSTWPTTVTEGDGLKFLVPSTPLTEDASWKITWSDSCSVSPSPYAPFRTATTMPLPTAIPEIKAVLGKANVSVDSCGYASLTIMDGAGTDGANIFAADSPELLAYGIVTRYELTVDGKPSSRFQIWTACGSSLTDKVEAVAPGKHVLAMRAIVANQPPTPWVTGEVTLSCGGSPPDADVPGTTDGSVSDAGVDTASAASSSSSGCSAPRRAPRDAGYLVFAIAALFALHRRR